MIQSYYVRGFTAVEILVNIQFAGLEDQFENVNVNMVSCDEHVTNIKRFIHVLKERCWYCFSIVPFRKIPQVMIIELLMTVQFYLNAFHWDDGPDDRLSPYNIFEGQHLDYNNHFQVIFGEYTHVSDGTNNTMAPCTVGAITLDPSCNTQGGVYFLNLVTGCVIHP